MITASSRDKGDTGWKPLIQRLTCTGWKPVSPFRIPRPDNAFDLSPEHEVEIPALSATGICC